MLTNETIEKLIELKFPVHNFMGNSVYELISNIKFEDIWRELPDYIVVDNDKYHLYLTKIGIDYASENCWYIDKRQIIDNNITEAAALLWIKLKEKGLL